VGSGQSRHDLGKKTALDGSGDDTGQFRNRRFFISGTGTYSVTLLRWLAFFQHGSKARRPSIELLTGTTFS